ncbi:MAG: N-acetylglucosamine kinase-like BadF-type ATPase, partial [Myxococcota bacterium]
RQSVVVGVDGGSTKTRAVVVDRATGECIGEGRVVGSTNLYMHAHAADPPAAAAAVLAAVISAAMPSSDCDVVAACVGTAGIDAPHDRARHSRAFDRALGLGDALLVMSDVEVIEACGTGPLRVNTIAGTGSNTLGIRLEGGVAVAVQQIGGLDLDLSDDGSAAWIGHHAFRAALRDLQHQERSALGPAVAAWCGLREAREPLVWRAFRTKRQGMHKSRLAALTGEIVAPLADTDRVARELLERAGSVLADNISAAARAVGGGDTLEVLRVGGVWRNPYVRARAAASLREEWPRVTLIDADAAIGAARFARRLADGQRDARWPRID